MEARARLFSRPTIPWVSKTVYNVFGPSTRTFLVLSIDHDLKRPRKLCPRSNEPFAEATLAFTLFQRQIAHLERSNPKCLRRHFRAVSGNIHLCSGEIRRDQVPVRIRVETTSAGTVTSEAPLSMTKSRGICR